MLRRLTSSQIQKTLKKSFSEELKKPNLTKTGNSKEVFLDLEKFRATGTYMIYQSKDLTKMRLIFLGALAIGSYHTYSYFWGDSKEFDETANSVFACLSCVTVAWMSWRTRKTLKSLEILEDGKTFLLKKNSWFGFKEDVYSFNHTGMRGVGYFIDKRVRMPMVRVRDEYNNKMDVSFNFFPFLEIRKFEDLTR